MPPVSRRDFIEAGAAGLLTATALLPDCAGAAPATSAGRDLGGGRALCGEAPRCRGSTWSTL
jgi:hypothetical protein